MNIHENITCESCGGIYNKREVHICGQNALVEMSHLRQRVGELEDERSIFARTLDKRDAELTLVKANAIELREEIKRLQNLLLQAGLGTYI